MDRVAIRAFIVRWRSGAEVPLDAAFEAYVETFVSGLRERARLLAR
jgi:hypothetical protein